MEHFFTYVLSYILFLPILTVHEFAHAWVAYLCGDSTAHRMGRLTLNPVAHIDPVGTVAIPILNLLFGGSAVMIGWGRPVPVNPVLFRNPRRDDVLVSLAGPFSNFLFAFVALVFIRFVHSFSPASPLNELLVKTAYFSIFLGFFNLIPIPPLDGSHLMKVFFCLDESTYARFSSIGFILLIVLVNIHAVREFIFAMTMKVMAIMYSVVSIV